MGRRPDQAPKQRLILASRSPRRRSILAELGAKPELVAPRVAELSEGEPGELVLENARRKALAALDDLSGPTPAAAGGAELVVIACDTEVAIDGRVLGKPADEAGARERLERLAGRSHDVLSGLVVARRGDISPFRVASRLIRSRVSFAPLDAELLDAYLASEEWRGKAGAYAIQGLGSMLVERVDGDFSNVVGLPLRALRELVPELFPSPSAIPPKP